MNPVILRYDNHRQWPGVHYLRVLEENGAHRWTEDVSRATTFEQTETAVIHRATYVPWQRKHITLVEVEGKKPSRPRS